MSLARRMEGARYHYAAANLAIFRELPARIRRHVHSPRPRNSVIAQVNRPAEALNYDVERSGIFVDSTPKQVASGNSSLRGPGTTPYAGQAKHRHLCVHTTFRAFVSAACPNTS